MAHFHTKILDFSNLLGAISMDIMGHKWPLGHSITVNLGSREPLTYSNEPIIGC